VAGQDNPNPHPRCTETLKDGSPCKTVEKRDALCEFHLRERDQRAAEPLTPSVEDEVPEAEARAESVNGTPASVSPYGLRDQLAEDIASRYGQYVALLFNGLSAEKTYYIDCPHYPECKKRHSAAFPDWTARINAFDKMMQHGFGRPTDASKARPPSGSKTLKRLADMTDEELLAMIGDEDPDFAVGVDGYEHEPER
jgi:hypothetical protein